MMVVKKMCWVCFVVLAFYYVGELVAFANTLEWHNNNHPITLISDEDGKIVDGNGLKIGDYYLTDIGKHNLYLNANLEDKDECSICKGIKNKPLLIKIIWPLCGIDNKGSNGNKTLAKK